MNPNKALWENGDFTRVAESMRESGEAFVQTLGVEPGTKVLDLGCGDGTTALPLARLGADVTGIDIARKFQKKRASIGYRLSPKGQPLPFVHDFRNSYPPDGGLFAARSRRIIRA